MLPTFQHVSHGSVKLGGHYKLNLKTLPLSNYVRPSAMAYPPVCAWERPITWGMLGNDSVGDCVIAWMMHHAMGMKAVAQAGTPLSFTTDQALQTYSAITGYVPGDPSTDNGTDPDTAATYWQQTGLYGDKILGYVNLDITNQDLVKYAHYTFGGIGISLEVPDYIMNVPSGGSWSQTPGANTTIDGGHQIYAPGYGRQGWHIISWGTDYTFNLDFWSQYVQAAIAVVSTDWVKASGVSPSGLNLQALLADLQAA